MPLSTGTVLVTGAPGQLGRRVVRLLIARGYRVRGTRLPDGVDPAPAPRPAGLNRLRSLAGASLRALRSRHAPQTRARLDPFAGLTIDWATGDLRDARFAAAAVDGVDAVIHTANVPHERAFENNVLATLNVARACADRARAIRRLVHVSSSAVYPNDPDVTTSDYHPVDERHPLRPVGPYGRSKLVGETLVRGCAFESGLAATVVRPSFVVSGDAVLGLWSVSTVAGLMTRAARHPESEMHAGVGTAWQDLKRAASARDQPCAVTDRAGRPWLFRVSDARDIAEGIVRALESADAAGRTFNLSAPEATPYPEAAAILAELTGAPALAYAAPVRFVYDLDDRDARRTIGYAPVWTIRRMIEDALAFRRGERDGLT